MAHSILGPTSGLHSVEEVGVCTHGAFSLHLFNPSSEAPTPCHPRDLLEGPGTWQGKLMGLGKGKLWPSGWEGLLEPLAGPTYQPIQGQGTSSPPLPAVDTGMRWNSEAFLLHQRWEE